MSKVGLAAKIRHSGKSSKPEKSADRDPSRRVRITAEVKSTIVEKVPVGHDSLCRHGHMRTYGEVLTHARDSLPLHSHYTQMSDVISVLKILQDLHSSLPWVSHCPACFILLKLIIQ